MKKLYLIVLLFLTTVYTHAQWMDGGAKQSKATSGSGAIHVHKNAMYLYNEEHGIMKSTDWGSSWNDIEDVGLPPVGPGIAKNVSAFASVGNRLYACMNLGNGGGMVFYSNNDGASWNMDTLGAPGQPLGWGGLPTMGTTVCGWGNWLFIHFGGVKNYYVKHIDSAFRKSAYLVENVNNPRSVAAKGDTLFISSVYFSYTTDGGVTWTKPQNNGYPSAGGGGKLAVDGNRIYLLATSNFNKPVMMYYTDDNGNNWTPIDITSLSNQTGTNSILYQYGTMFVKGNYMEITFANGKHIAYRSTDMGTTWKDDNEGITTLQSVGHAWIGNFIYTPNGYLWCSLTHENVYKKKIDGGSTSGIDDTITAQVSIAPNPVYGECTVHIPNTTYTSLSMYNVRGEKVYHTTLSPNPTTEQTELYLSTHHLAKGCYRIVLHSPLHTTSTAIVVE